MKNSTRLGLGYRIGLAFILFVAFVAVILQVVQYRAPGKLTDIELGYAALGAALCAAGAMLLPQVIALRVPILNRGLLNRGLQVLGGVVIFEVAMLVATWFVYGGDGGKAFAVWASGELLVFRAFEALGVLKCLGYIITGRPPSPSDGDDGPAFNFDGTPMVRGSGFDMNGNPSGGSSSNLWD